MVCSGMNAIHIYNGSVLLFSIAKIIHTYLLFKRSAAAFSGIRNLERVWLCEISDES